MSTGMAEWVKRSGTQYIARAEAGDRLSVVNGLVVITNPNHPARFIAPDGTIKSIEPQDSPQDSSSLRHAE